MSAQEINYDDEFYCDLTNTAGPSASVVVPLVQALVGAQRVVDVGCGDASWLASFQRSGAQTVLGLDGKWLDLKVLKIPPERFSRVDLFSKIILNERFDLAICLEVAEHLPETRAASFVSDLVRLAPVILFSAAIPLQQGPNHLNEQWPSYWADLFSRHDYLPIDAIRMHVWTDPRVTWWYKQNILLYVAQAYLRTAPSLTEAHARYGGAVRDLVHPEKYRALAKRAHPTFGRWLRMLPMTFSPRRTF